MMEIKQDQDSSTIFDENLTPAVPREILVSRITPDLVKKVKGCTYLVRRVSVNVARLTTEKIQKYKPPVDLEKLERIKKETITIIKSSSEKSGRKRAPKTESVKSKDKSTPVKKAKVEKVKVEKVKTEKVAKGKDKSDQEDDKPAKRSLRSITKKSKYNDVFSSDSETEDEFEEIPPPPKEENDDNDVKVQPQNSAPDVNVQEPPAPLICANGLSPCKETGLASFPCKRCHREYYCCKEHQADAENIERHKAECKTPAHLEVIVDHEYDAWLHFSAPYLYDILLNFVLVWPSLTVQWFPDQEEIGDITRHKILMGTQTTGETNHLMLCAIDVSKKSKSSGNFRVLKRINHEGEIHRARFMPQDQDIIATKSPSKDVFVFKTSDYPEIPEDEITSHTVRLVGHTKDGFGLSWNREKSGWLASSSADGSICIWDINGTQGENKTINAHTTLNKHTGNVEDVDWGPYFDHTLASVGVDKKLVLWDTRTNEASSFIDNAHDGDINAVSFSPYSEHVMATGGCDKIVAIWDSRRFVKPLITLESHTNTVMQVDWSPKEGTFLASAGSDKKVFLWDLRDQKPDPLEDKTKKKSLFMHGGHVMPVSDVSWNPTSNNLIASVSEDNILQVWKICKDMFDKEEEDDQ